LTTTDTTRSSATTGTEPPVAHRLQPLFAPRGIVVVGASTNPDKLGGAMAASLSRYGGEVALVNPRGTGMHPTVRSALDASTSGIDLAVLCVPATACADVVAECGEAGVRAALVCAGGFAEVGGQGIERQAHLLEAATRSGVRLLGPNTSGFFAPPRGLLASFVPGVASLAPGPVGVVAASGGLNHALAFAFQRAGCGLSLGVGIGAGIDVAAPEVIDYLALDPGTRAIALHLENVTDGPALLAAVRQASRRKPVVAMVVGQHDVGAFARSHTGALATSWRSTRELLGQAGAVVVDDVDALVVATSVLSSVRIDPRTTPRAALITAQAGPGLVIADALHHAGVGLPALADQTRAALADLLPPLTYQANPVDTGRPGPRHAEVISQVAQDEAVDLVAVYGLTEPVVDLVGSATPAHQAGHAVVVGIDGPGPEVAAARGQAAAAGVPLVVGPNSLATAVAALAEDSRRRGASPYADDAPTPWDGAPLPAGPWSEDAAKQVLAGAGVPTPIRRVCASRADARQALAAIGGPVVVKVSDATILHKSDVGGIRLGITDVAALDRAFDDLAALGDGNVLVEQMIGPGLELIVGARRDPIFGPVVMVGVGGTATEIYADVAIAAIPCPRDDLVALPDRLQARRLLDGYRGAPAVDREALADVLVAVGGILLGNPQVAEVEINPLRSSSTGLIALDAVLVARDPDNISRKEQ
jgi:acetate---CoA ligase (ADP-forming)